MTPDVATEPFDPSRVLATMGASARASADTWTMRQWAGRLATRAAPHDYVGQLRELYRGIVARMRYVQEPEEWVYGTPRAALGFGLGAAYNKSATCPSPEHCDVEATRWRELGFGDCDDMSIIAAAGALSLGMQVVLFRVARGPGWAHVSVTTRTPAGEWVELDPVAWPRHSRAGEVQPGFNWAVTGPGVTVEHFDLEGKPVGAGTGGSMFGGFGAYAIPGMGSPAPTYYAGFVEPNPDEGGELDVGPIESVEPEGHLVAVSPEDTLGPRVVAMPHDEADMFRRGACVDGATGVTQFGEIVRYCGARDLWIPENATDAAGVGFGSWWGDRFKRRAKRRKKIKRFFQKVGRGIKRVAMAVGKAARKVVGAVLSSKIVQRILARTISAFGVPAILSRKIMAIAGKFVQQGGLIKLFKMLRKDPKGALRMLAASVAAAGRGVLSALPELGAPGGFSGVGGGFGAFAGVGYDDDPVLYEVEQDGQRYHAAPVAALAGLPGVASFGALEITPTPTPGFYYQVTAKDSGLLDLAGRAYGLKPGADRLERAQWIANSSRPSWKMPLGRPLTGLPNPGASTFSKARPGPAFRKPCSASTARPLLPPNSAKTNCAKCPRTRSWLRS